MFKVTCSFYSPESCVTYLEGYIDTDDPEVLYNKYAHHLIENEITELHRMGNCGEGELNFHLLKDFESIRNEIKSQGSIQPYLEYFGYDDVYYGIHEYHWEQLELSESESAAIKSLGLLIT